MSNKKNCGGDSVASTNSALQTEQSDMDTGGSVGDIEENGSGCPSSCSDPLAGNVWCIYMSFYVCACAL